MSEMVIPLVTGDVLLGLLDIQAAHRDAFTDDDRRVCYALADQVSIAIRNASRYEPVDAQRTLSDTLYAVARALSQTLDVFRGARSDSHKSGQDRNAIFRASVLLRRDDVLETVAARGFPRIAVRWDIRVRIKPGDASADDLRVQRAAVIPMEQRAV